MLCTRNGWPIGQRNAHATWTRLLQQAGVEHRGIHHMRHAYVTMLAEQGVHERVAQHLAGHVDSRMTRLVYTHVTRAMLEGATAAVERAAQDLYSDVAPQAAPPPPELPGETPSTEGENPA